MECRSKSPDQDLCIKERGHKTRWHQGLIPGKAGKTERWEGGINTPAIWEHIEDYVGWTEADHDTYNRWTRWSG